MKRSKLLALATISVSLLLLVGEPATAQRSADDKMRAQALFRESFELYQADELDAAVIGFSEGLKLDPKNGAGHFYIAEVYSRQNKPDLARQHYERAVALVPQTKEGLLARSRLAALNEKQAAVGKWLGNWTYYGQMPIEITLRGQDLIITGLKPFPMTEAGSNVRFEQAVLFGPSDQSTLKGTLALKFDGLATSRCFQQRFGEVPITAKMSPDQKEIDLVVGGIPIIAHPNCRHSLVNDEYKFTRATK